MLKSLYSGVSGMKSNQTKMDVIGNNIANVGTSAFKKSSVNFADTLYQTKVNSSAGSANFGGVNISQTGMGTKVANIITNCAQGSLQTTGRPTDFAVDGDGYFMVVKGDIVNEPDTAKIQYTRAGAFSIDEKGTLVTPDGYRVIGKVLDDAGQETGEWTPIEIPSTVEVDDGKGGKIEKKVVAFEISVNGNGVVTVTTEDGTKKDIARLELAIFTNPEGLEKVGGNRYMYAPNVGDIVYLTDGESTAFGWITQGYLEMSNVDLSEEFTDMIVTQRSFQANSKIITTSDEMLQEILGLKR